MAQKYWDARLPCLSFDQGTRLSGKGSTFLDKNPPKLCELGYLQGEGGNGTGIALFKWNN